MGSLKESIDSLLENLNGFVDKKTVIGDAIKTGDVTIIPLSEISLGVGVGAYGKTDGDNAGGGMGAKISPVGLVIIKDDGSVRFINTKNNAAIDKILETVPELMTSIKNTISKVKDKAEVVEKEIENSETENE